MHFVHIVDAALNQALKHPDIQGKLASGTRIRIGLLATKGTVQMGLYQNRLEELKKSNPKLANFEIVVPSENIQENYITKGIYDPELGVKANNLEAGGSLIKEGARQFIADAAAENKPIDMVALACTELPLVVKEGDIRLNGGADGASMPIIDASDALAAEVLAKSIELGQRRENAAAPERRTEGVLPAVGNTIANVARTATSWAESLAAHSSSQLLAPAASAASPAPASSPDVPAAPPVVPVAPQASSSRGVGRR
jgi:aspartate/glutamate racemase